MAERKVDSFGEAEVFSAIQSHYAKINRAAQAINGFLEVRGGTLRRGVIHEVNCCEALADKRPKAGFGPVGSTVIQNNRTNPMIHIGKLVPMISANSKIKHGYFG